jgi:hypothetical protein
MSFAPVVDQLLQVGVSELIDGHTCARASIADSAKRLEEIFNAERKRIRSMLWSETTAKRAYCVLDFRARWRCDNTYLYLEWSTQASVPNGKGGRRPLREKIAKSRATHRYSIPVLLGLVPEPFHDLVTRTELLARPIRGAFEGLRDLREVLDRLTRLGVGDMAPRATKELGPPSLLGSAAAVPE